jgi:hypothetical protein
MKKNLLLFALLPYFILPSSASAINGDRAFTELVFIDHINLRYVEGAERAKEEVEHAKRNIDKAAQYGIHSYLLFAKESMEAILTYDFEVPGIGTVGRKAFPNGSKHRRTADYMRQALNDVIEHARSRNVRLFFHSNQFIFPEEVLDVIRPATWGTAVCPGREATWAVYRGKIDEFFRLFPDIAGLQITGDETQVSAFQCECEKCREMNFVERVNRLTNETAAVARKYGKEVQMRTWQRMGELGDPSNMERGILDNVSFSIKNTDGDFRLSHVLDKKFLTAAVPSRVICEFDAWREYEGHNYFPCYMGNDWASRFRFLQDEGIQRIAVRLMWNSNKNPIFERPWGNYVNLYAFLKLSENPRLDGQEVLRMFVREHYPEDSWRAAMDIYNFSRDFQRTIYYIKGKVYNANHSRVQDNDAVEDLKDSQDDLGFLTNREDFDKRREEIDTTYAKAINLVGKLGSDVSPEWIQGLKDGARVERYVALSSTDKMEIFFLLQRRKAGDNVRDAIAELKQRMEERIKEWQEWDSDSYDDMEGKAVFEDWS